MTPPFITAPQPDDVLEMLIRKLAERHSQKEVATILNERGLHQPRTGTPWKQFSISRYMKQHNIKAPFKWKGYSERTRGDGDRYVSI